MKLMLLLVLLFPLRRDNIYAEIIDCISVRPRIEQGYIGVESTVSGNYCVITNPNIEVIKGVNRVYWDKNKEIISVIINLN